MAGRSLDRLLELFREVAGAGTHGWEPPTSSHDDASDWNAPGTPDGTESSVAEHAGWNAAVRTEKATAGSTTVLDATGTLFESARTEARGAAPGLYESSATPLGSDVHSTSTGSNQSSSGGGSSVGSIAMTFLESGLGVASLVKGLIGIFSGGDPAPPPVQKYEMPEAIHFESAETASGLSAADYGQAGNARAVTHSASADQPAAGPAGGASPQITVNVQAMDAQSFMDHSSAIAQAVREAMLNSSSINDVVSEL